MAQPYRNSRPMVKKVFFLFKADILNVLHRFATDD